MWAWMEKQICRLEQALFRRTREAINAYLSGMIERSGEHRTLGKEQGISNVPIA
jgi:hypothetical protein